MHPDDNRVVTAPYGATGIQLELSTGRTNLERPRDALIAALVDLDAESAATPTVEMDSVV